MKKRLLACAVSLWLGGGTVQAAGIPVIDAAGLAQAVQSFQQLQMQYQSLMSQLEQMKREYGAFTGDRGMAGLFWSSQLRSTMPADMSSVFRRLAQTGPDALPAEARSYYDQNGMGAVCDRLRTGARPPCYRQQAYYAYMQTQYAEGARRVEERSRSIELLMKKIQSAQDPKAIEDLSVRVQAENASLQAETVRLQALSQVQKSQEALLAQQRDESVRQWLDTSNMTREHIRELTRSPW